MADLVKVLGILEDARGLIDSPGGWWDGRVSHDGNCCALTAIGRQGTFVAQSGTTPAFEAARFLADQMGISDACRIPEFNDSHTHAEVLAAFDKAIATIKAEMDPEPDPTPNADMALAVLEACESAGEVVARQIVSTRPDLDFENVAEVASSELFYAAQDAAWAFEMGVKLVRS